MPLAVSLGEEEPASEEDKKKVLTAEEKKKQRDQLKDEVSCVVLYMLLHIISAFCLGHHDSEADRSHVFY